MPDTDGGLLAFTMPALGADMDAGTVTEWLVHPGSTVKRGDTVAIVQTDKSDIDVEVFFDGTIVDLVVAPGEKVPVGTVLAHLAPAGVAVPTKAKPPEAAKPAKVRKAHAAPEPQPVKPVRPAPLLVLEPTRVSSPVLRHLADQLHVDLSRVHGSGSGGRITRDDIERASPARRVSPRARRLARQAGVDLSGISGTGLITGVDVLALVETPVPRSVTPTPAPVPPDDAGSSMRRTISRLMTKSWREIPHYHVSLRIDVHNCLESLAKINEQRDATSRILAGAVMAHAAARAAAAVPGVNGYWVDDAFVPGEGVHLALVVALRRGGLLAPVIHDAADKSLDVFMGEMRDLVTRARNGRLRSSELSGATVTVTELGEGEVDSVMPIIHPPQVAILGIGAIHDEPWAEHGMLAVRPVVQATLAGDHRAVDGRLGSLYLNAFKRILEEPIKP